MSFDKKIFKVTIIKINQNKGKLRKKKKKTLKRRSIKIICLESLCNVVDTLGSYCITFLLKNLKLCKCLN